METTPFTRFTAGGWRRDRAVCLASRAGARQFRPRISGRADRPRESPGRAQGVDENDPRAVAAGAGAACQHRRDRVPRQGERRRFPVDLHAVLGGATLAAVLAARAEREDALTSGIDLLADLDSVAAPEFPAVHAARPAREMLAGLSYSQAVAWVGARLAEALDHAFSRDVAHGDVKPSNILLSADANPLLLDFNLARDWSPAGLSHSNIDPGGTLAYMAPERLRGLAMDDPAPDDSSRAGRELTSGQRGNGTPLRTSPGEQRRASARTAPGRHLRAGNGLAGSADRPASGTRRHFRPARAGHPFRPAKIRRQRVCIGPRQGARAHAARG